MWAKFFYDLGLYLIGRLIIWQLNHKHLIPKTRIIVPAVASLPLRCLKFSKLLYHEQNIYASTHCDIGPHYEVGKDERVPLFRSSAEKNGHHRKYSIALTLYMLCDNIIDL